MDALEARRSGPATDRPAPVPPTPEAIREVARTTWQLPVLLSGGWSPSVALGNTEALLRLQAAVWQLAARRQVLVGPDATAVEVARLLAERQVIAPASARVVSVLSDALAVEGYDVEACRLAARLEAHLALRARYG